MMDRKPVQNIQFYSKNKFEKLVHLVGYIIRIYHDVRCAECQNLTPSVPSLCISSSWGFPFSRLPAPMNNSKLFYRLGVLVHNFYFKKILVLYTITKLQLVNTTFIVSVYASLICLRGTAWLPLAESSLTLCRSNLKLHCMGRKTVFFQQAFKFTYYTRNRSPLQEKNHNN